MRTNLKIEAHLNRNPSDCVFAIETAGFSRIFPPFYASWEIKNSAHYYFKDEEIIRLVLATGEPVVLSPGCNINRCNFNGIGMWETEATVRLAFEELMGTGSPAERVRRANTALHRFFIEERGVPARSPELPQVSLALVDITPDRIAAATIGNCFFAFATPQFKYLTANPAFMIDKEARQELERIKKKYTHLPNCEASDRAFREYKKQVLNPILAYRNTPKSYGILNGNPRALKYLTTASYETEMIDRLCLGTHDSIPHSWTDPRNTPAGAKALFDLLRSREKKFGQNIIGKRDPFSYEKALVAATITH